MKINNGERVHRNRYTVIPMPEEVVDKVHRLAKRQKFLKEGIEFRDRKNELIDDADDENNLNRNITGVEGVSEIEPETDTETDNTSSNNPSDDEDDDSDYDPEYDGSDDDDDDSSDDDDRPGLQRRSSEDSGDDYDGMPSLQERAREDSSSEDDNDGTPEVPDSPPVEVAPTSPSRREERRQRDTHGRGRGGRGGRGRGHHGHNSTTVPEQAPGRQQVNKRAHENRRQSVYANVGTLSDRNTQTCTK